MHLTDGDAFHFTFFADRHDAPQEFLVRRQRAHFGRDVAQILAFDVDHAPVGSHRADHVALFGNDQSAERHFHADFLSAFVNGFVLFVDDAQREARHGMHDVAVAEHAPDDAPVPVDQITPPRRRADDVLFGVQHHAVLREASERIALIVDHFAVADRASERRAVKRDDHAFLHQSAEIFAAFVAHDAVEIDASDFVHASVQHAPLGVQIADDLALRADHRARRNDQTDQRAVVVDHAAVVRHAGDVFAVFEHFARIHAQHARVHVAGRRQNVRIHHAVADDGVHFVRDRFVGQEFADRAALLMHDVAAHGNASQKVVGRR